MNNDLISREALKEDFESVGFNDYDDYNRALRIIDNAPTVETYSEEDMCNATSDGYDVGYDFAKKIYEFDTEGFKKFVESRIDMQDLYLPIHFFDLIDEYKMKGGKE